MPNKNRTKYLNIVLLLLIFSPLGFFAVSKFYTLGSFCFSNKKKNTHRNKKLKLKTACMVRPWGAKMLRGMKCFSAFNIVTD